MQLGRSAEVRALAVPEIPAMQEAGNFWRLSRQLFERLPCVPVRLFSL